MTAKNTLKEWFSNFKKPTQNHFWAWIDSFWHKEDKIPMQNIEGLDTALQGIASSEQLNNHLTDTQAHKTLFDGKVDKEDGKGLSANDYSDEEKGKLHDTANKVAVNMTVTGDVNKILTLTFADGTTLKAPFKDLAIDNIADIKLNSLNFNTQTGVLTGVRSDGQELTVDLDGRYALTSHTHSYNDLEDKPVLLPEAPTDGKHYMRSNSTWKAFEGLQFRELQLENLNDIKEFGFYGKYNSPEVTTARNYPHDALRGGHLLVLPMTESPSTLTVFQVFFSAGTQNADTYTSVGRIFFRTFLNNSSWTTWQEFDGGKIFDLTSATQNLSVAFRNAFPNNNATFILKQGTTVTVSNSVQRVTYIKHTDANITFTPEAGVTIIGDRTITAPSGTLIHLICNGTTAYVCYNSGNSGNNTIENNIGVWQ